MFLEPDATRIQSGWIEVICGSMFSGKTEELIRRLRRAQIAGQQVEIFKPAIDTRYHPGHIVSHDQRAIPSTPVSSAQQIILLAGNSSVVGIDEAQFFDDEIVEVVNTLANSGQRVVIAGLDMDFRGKPFGPMPQLLAIAEFVTKLHAICVKTGGLAHFSHRKTDYGRDNQNPIMIGEKESYEPLSRAAYLAALQREEANKKI
jgi:thymidine kinase